MLCRLRGYDPDGDNLTFGLAGREAGVVRLVPRDPYSADLYLAQQLDHETRQEHSLLLTLTDSKLGQDNFITQVGTGEITGSNI